jgi:hypothetical protein
MRLHTVIAFAALIAGAGCASVTGAVDAYPGSPFTLAPGETAALQGTDARITLNAVRDDSRCPVDVTCVWAGDAKIEIVVSRKGAADETTVLSITPPKNEVWVGNLKIRFVSLAPAPRQADAGTARKYRAELVVDQSVRTLSPN